MTKLESSTYMKQGSVAPDFTLQGINGENFSRDDVTGKSGLFVLFMCNHCPYVKARIDDVVKLHEEFGGQIGFVAINSSDPEYPGEGMENMKKFAQERRITFPYVLDEDGAIAKTYGATCTPDPFLFDSDMKLVFHGRINDALEPQDTPTEFTMRENMQKLINGETIDEWFNPSLGCSIKFKS